MSLFYISLKQAIEVHHKTVDISGGGAKGHLDVGKLGSCLEHIQNDDYYPTIYIDHNYGVEHSFISQKINPIPEGSSQEIIDILNDKTGQIISISFLVLNAVGALLPKFVLEPITERIGRVKTQVVSVAIMSIGYWGIVFFARTELSLYLFMLVAGIGWAAIVSLPFAIMSETVDESKMGFYMGMFNLSIVIPQLIVSAVFGTFIQNTDDKSLVFIISGITLAISSVVWLIVKEQKVANQ